MSQALELGTEFAVDETNFPQQLALQKHEIEIHKFEIKTKKLSAAKYTFMLFDPCTDMAENRFLWFYFHYGNRFLCIYFLSHMSCVILW